MSKTHRRRSSAVRGATDLLVADCGGTNVRFAVAQAGADNAVALSATRKLVNDDFGSFDDALTAYLEDLPARPAAAAIAFAGAVSHGAGALTNRPTWRIDAAALARRFGFQDVLVVNDFAAAARGAVALPDGALLEIKPGAAEPGEPVVVGGPGTGFGMASVLPEQGRWRVLPGEGGHQTFAPETELEWALAKALRAKHGHVSVEIVAAGKHAEEVREALCAILGEPFEPLPPHEVLARAAAGDRGCRAYCELRVAATMAALGDAVLMVGAKGGAVIMGGVSEHLLDYFRAPAAVERFSDHGVMSDYLRATRVRLAAGSETALIGAAKLRLD